MGKTGELGADFGDLGDLELGSTQILGDVVENTSGLILLYKCDDPAGQATLAEKFGKNATVNLGTTAYTAGVSGAIDSAITTPSATPASPTKNTAPHLTFDYTGANINIGTAGTIEMWFKPAEFGDPLSTSPSLPAVDYEILRLNQTGGSSVTIQFMAGITNPSNAPIIRCQFTPTAGSGTLLSDSFASEALSAEGLKPIHPVAEVGRWYYMVFTWNTSVAEAYCNGVLVSRNFATSHPPSITTGNLHFGNCGGTYDSIAILNRKLTSAEVAGRFSAGQQALPVPGARLSSFYLNYAAAYNAKLRVTQARLEVLRDGVRNVRVTQQRLETLRDGPRNVRVTNQFIEVLRSTADSGISRSLSQTLTFTQTATATVVRSASVSQTLTFTQTAMGGHDANISVNQTLALTQTATATVIRSASVSQTLTFTQNVFRTIFVTASQTLPLNQTVTYDNTKIILHTLAFTETVTASVVRNRSVLQSLNLVETVNLNRDFSVNAAQTLGFTEAVAKSKVVTRSVLQTLNIVQSQVSYATHEGVDHLAFTQSAVATIVRSRSISQTLSFTQTVTAGFIYSRTAHQSLIFTQFVMGNPNLIGAPRDSFLSTSELGDLILGEIDGVENGGVDLLDFNQTVGLQRIIHRSVTQTLNFVDSAIRGPIIWNRSISQTLHFFENDVPLDLELSTGGGSGADGVPAIITRPVAMITKVSRLVIISSRYQTIVLPTPEFGDTEAAGNQVDIKRSMSGKVYSYVKTADWYKLNYDFTLTRRKAMELRIFIQRNLSEVLTLQNWKGQIYKGQFTNNPVSFNTSGRYGRSYEKVVVTLEIEGVRIHG